MAEEFPKQDETGDVIDYLEEDTEIPTQRYALVSFISPEKVIKQKDRFFNEKFIQWLEYDWKIKGMESYNAFLAKKYSIKVEELFKDLEEFTKVHNEEIRKTDVVDKYATFLMKNEKDLETEYTEKVQFRTNVRGVKIRRVFANLEEAQMMAKVFQRKYPRDNLFLGKVGCWVPWDPSEHMMPEVEYATQELNELMRKYKENEANKDLLFEEDKAAKIKAQKEENARRKKEALEDQGLQTIEDVGNALTNSEPVHPAEGAVRE